MEVYKFNKCLLDRLEESMLVLPWKEELITPSQVRMQWACFIELQIEPAGWQAIWNIPRVICEVLNLRYPTSAFGHVEQVLFKELRAVFVVDAVQDEDVHFMQRQEVALEDLWPTIAQENNALNVDRTADCLDRLRFFYTHVWMPWDFDNDDDMNWAEKHLESRIRFCYDLRKGCIRHTLAQHIRTLLTEARYIHQRREFLELGLSEDEDDGGKEKIVGDQQVTDLMRLHLRLSMIRNEIEIVENPAMRYIYEKVHFGSDEKGNKSDVNLAKPKQQIQCFIVTKPSTVGDQIELLHKVDKQIESNCVVKIVPELLTALNECKPYDKIFLAPGEHSLKFLEYLTDGGYMSGVLANQTEGRNNPYKGLGNQVTVSSPDDDSMLLTFNGDYTLENLYLDCRNVRTGILIRSGTVVLRNCQLIGDGKSSTQQGIVCTGKGKLTLVDCLVEKFANGIILHEGTEFRLSNTKIENCKVGLEINAQVANVSLNMACIKKAEKCGIYVDNMKSEHLKEKFTTVNGFKELTELTSWTGDCQFQFCKSNIYILNQKMSLLEAKFAASITNESDEEWLDAVDSTNNDI